MSAPPVCRRFPLLATIYSWFAPSNAKPASKPSWKVVANYDLDGHPVCLFRDPVSGGELALDYATRERQVVPIARLRERGRRIDFAEHNGLMAAHVYRGRTPVVAVAPDGCAVVVTAKTAMTRLATRDPRKPRWQRGLHVQPDAFGKMRRVEGAAARELIADSHRWDAHVPEHDLVEALARATDADLRSVGLQRRSAHDDLSTHPHGELPPVFIVATKLLAAEAIARIRRNAAPSQARDGETA